MLSRLTRGRAALLIVTTAFVTAGVAVAVTSTIYTDTAGVYHGCVNSGVGNLRVVIPGEKCRAGEVAIEWNQVGPQGPRGIPGEKGEPGEPGEPGGLNGILDLVGKPCEAKGITGRLRLAESFSYSLVPLCLIRDPLESNDTAETAAVAPWITRTGFSSPERQVLLDTPTIYPAGDVDWFIIGTEDADKPISFYGYSPALGKVRYQVFKDGFAAADLVATSETGQPGLGVPVFRAPADGQHHTYYVRVVAVTASEESIFQLNVIPQ